MPRHRGFTLIEITVVVAILGIILAVALPSLLKMVMVGNEATIIQTIRSVVQACEEYRMRESQGAFRSRYPAALNVLTGSIPPYLDRRFRALTGGTPWRGYVGRYVPSPEQVVVVGNVPYQVRAGYTLTADPVQRGWTGQRSFFVDQTGLVRFNPQRPATVNDQPLDQDG